MNDPGEGAGLPRRALVHVKARTATALGLPVGQLHDLGEVEVAISNWIEKDAAGPIHRGLFFDTRARSATPDGARSLAMRACDGVLSSLCFVGGTGAGPLEPLAVFWDMVDGCHLQQFIEPVAASDSERGVQGGS